MAFHRQQNPVFLGAQCEFRTHP